MFPKEKDFVEKRRKANVKEPIKSLLTLNDFLLLYSSNHYKLGAVLLIYSLFYLSYFQAFIVIRIHHGYGQNDFSFRMLKKFSYTYIFEAMTRFRIFRGNTQNTPPCKEVERIDWIEYQGQVLSLEFLTRICYVINWGHDVMACSLEFANVMAFFYQNSKFQPPKKYQMTFEILEIPTSLHFVGISGCSTQEDSEVSPQGIAFGEFEILQTKILVKKQALNF